MNQFLNDTCIEYEIRNYFGRNIGTISNSYFTIANLLCTLSLFQERWTGKSHIEKLKTLRSEIKDECIAIVLTALDDVACLLTTIKFICFSICSVDMNTILVKKSIFFISYFDSEKCCLSMGLYLQFNLIHFIVEFILVFIRFSLR